MFHKLIVSFKEKRVNTRTFLNSVAVLKFVKLIRLTSFIST